MYYQLKKMSQKEFMDIIEEGKDISGIKGKVKTIHNQNKKKENLKYQAPKSYSLNIDEEYTLEEVLTILKYGIQRKKTRQ